MDGDAPIDGALTDGDALNNGDALNDGDALNEDVQASFEERRALFEATLGEPGDFSAEEEAALVELSERRTRALFERYPDMPVLAGLEFVRWAELDTGGYNPCNAVIPQHLQRLFCPDPKVRDDTWDFWHDVFHTNSVGPGTHHILPYLRTILEHKDGFDKDRIFAFLAELATSAWQGLRDRAEFLRLAGAKNLEQRQAELLDDARDLREGLGQLVPLGVGFLTAEDWELAAQAALFLLACESERPQVLEAIAEAFAGREPGSGTELVLGKIRRDVEENESPALRRWVLEQAGSSSPPPARFEAALCELTWTPSPTPQIIEALIDAARSSVALPPGAVSIEALIGELYPGAAIWPRRKGAVPDTPEVALAILLPLIADENPGLAHQAMRASIDAVKLWRSAGPVVAAALAARLGDASQAIRSAAAGELAGLGRHARPHLDVLAPFLEAASPVRGAVAEAFADNQDPRVLAFLRERLAAADQEALALSSRLGGLAVELLPELMVFLDSEADPRLRQRACEALASLDLGEAALPALEPLLALLEAELPSRSASVAFINTEAAQRAARGLERSTIISIQAIASLGAKAGERALPLLLPFLQDPIGESSEERHPRVDLLRALVRLGAPNDVVLPEALKLFEIFPVYGLYQVLGALGDDRALPALRAVDASRGFRVQVAKAILNITGEPEAVIPLLLEALDWSPQSRECMEILASFGPAAAAARPFLGERLALDRRPVIYEMDERLIEAAEQLLKAIDGRSGERERPSP